jgi:hypothetical protein
MVQSRRRPGGFSWLCLLVVFFPGYAVVTDGAGTEAAAATRTRIQEIVDDFMARLKLTEHVAISVVPNNPLMLSVEFDDTDTGFLLSLDEDFVNELTDEELRAAIAHELGHVWIFTHHPYLQTEALANQIAQRLVRRDDLVQVYEKVWSRLGTKGDLARFVGN